MSSFNPQDKIIKLKGKDYLEVKWRLVWWDADMHDLPLEERPSIETEVVSDDGTEAVVKATIKDKNGRVLASDMKREAKKEFHDYLEKASTGAIGRTLALLGYGTQFADEFDMPEGKVVDSPVQSRFQPEPSSEKEVTVDEKEKRRQEAIERAKQAREKGGLATDTPESEKVDEPVADPITDGQKKAIDNVLKMIARKDLSFHPDNFMAELLKTKFKKSSLDELTGDEAKEVVQALNHKRSHG